MQIVCEHCGQSLTIGAEHLGKVVGCPHCKRSLQCPTLDKPPAARTGFVAHAWEWLEGSISALASVVIHAALFLILALVDYGGSGGVGDTEEVLIGSLPVSELTDTAEPELQPEMSAAAEVSRATELEMMVDIAPPTQATGDFSAAELAISAPTAGAGEIGSFELGGMSVGGGSMAGGNWEGMIQTLRRDGLDIVLTFDSTGSMGGEIREVKHRIERIGAALTKLVPKTRISLCTYRDTGDEYVVKGLPLTNDLQAVEAYLNKINAGGGGDHPEAVHSGLEWSITQNQFRPRARKVILLFGDAPPHDKDMKTCLKFAADFNSQQKGVVSTVTCHEDEALREFIDIAYAGGGEAFLSRDERQIMTQLLVLVFGSQYRGKVLEAFKVLEQ